MHASFPGRGGNESAAAESVVVVAELPRPNAVFGNLVRGGRDRESISAAFSRW